MRNWKILGIISSDSAIVSYALEKKITVKDEQNSVLSFLSQAPFDYLFSIVNEIILDKTILNLPLKLSVNYHDSLLPAGAGVFSTTWAIINREKEHGISWHIIDEGIDTGDILIQKKIGIEKEESSISLNLKCYQAAIKSFTELLDGLKSETLNQTKQDLSKRSYFPLKKRPANAGILNFTDPGLHLESLLAAMDFGEMSDNNFCTPKVLLGDQLYIPVEYHFIKSENNTRINCIEEATAKGIDINTGGGMTLSVTSLATIEGEKIGLDTLIEEFKLGPGVSLPLPDYSLVSQLHVLYERVIGNERYWVRKLSNLNLVDFPFITKEKKEHAEYSLSKIELDDALIEYCEQINTDGADINLCSILLMYVSRLLDNTEFDIWFKINSEPGKHPNLFSPYVPLGCKFDKNSTVVENLELNNIQLKQTMKKETFLRDIYTRIKILQELDVKSIAKKIPFFIGQIDSPDEFESILPVDWGILFSLNTKVLYLKYKSGGRNTLAAEKFFHHFSVFTQEIISQTADMYSEIPLLTKSEREKKIFKWNEQSISFPENACIHELIENFATTTPEEIAIVLKDQQITYKELNQKANKIAAYLIHKGIGQGEKVGVMMDRSIHMIVSFFGILKTGAAYVPFDMDLPDSRIHYMIDDTELKMMIISKKAIFSSNNMTAVLFEDIIKTTDAEPSAFPKISSGNLAYIKYTSGSTGQPKGVMIKHKNVLGFLYSYRQVVDVYEKRVGTCVAPLSFDTSVEEVYSCLCFGGTVHIMLKEQTTDLEYFARYIADNRINVSYIIPDFIEGVGKHLKNESKIPLKTLLTGLHAKKNSVFMPFFELPAPVRVINGYGPTEVTYGSNTYQVKGDEDPYEYTPIGKPLPNYSTYIVDSNMQLLPDYIPGELLIGGIGLSPGYLNKPEITDLKFVDFECGEFKAQVYKSGDMVYSFPSGDFQFVGRNDDQVKISGYRIEISEIEGALNSHEEVISSVVIKRKGKKHDQLIAYIILKTDIDNPGLHFQEFLKDKIPGYMIPAFIVPIDTIPQFSNGKINYALLPEPKYHRTSNSQNIKKPKSPTEEKIKQIFEEHLEIESIGVEDNFFDLGGDSITAVHIMEEIENVFGKKISVSMLYKYTSIRQLSDVLINQSSESTYNSIIPIREEGDEVSIIFMHDFSGSVFIYNSIIKRINKGYPLYGIQSNYKEDIDIEKDGLEKLSAIYIKNILKVPGQKRMVLIGFSFGGIVAFEMARQLNQLGHETCLIILDTSMSDIHAKMYPHKHKAINDFNWFRWALTYFGKSVYEIFKTSTFKDFAKRMHRIQVEFNKNFRKVRRKAPIEKTEEEKILAENKSISRKLVRKYFPELYRGKLHLIQCNGETEGVVVNKTRTNFFRPFVEGEIFIKQINTSHKNIFTEPYIVEVTEEIKSIIRSFNDSM